MKPTLPDDAEIFAVFSEETRRPLHVTEVAERLGLSFSFRRALGESLDAMAARGLLSPMPGGRYRLPRNAAREITGRFAQNPRGFGFVSADDGGPDVYIPATSVRGAMHGDRVALTVAEQSGNRREGVILRIVTRRPPRVPGVLRVRTGGAWVEPDDARIRGPIPLEEHADVRDGDAVVCEIVRWPEHTGELPMGRVRESLGRPGELDAEVRKVLLRECVEEEFAPEAIAEAAALPSKLAADDYVGREDLRSLPLVTIDPPDARDHDDAVYVRRRDDGGYVALIAIADVSHYVQPGTALDAAALSRGTSIYLPDRAIPMLPRELSSHLASLLEGEDRLTLAVEVQLSPEGKHEKTRVIEGVMRCHASLSYQNVAWALGWSDLGTPSDAAMKFKDDLLVAAECAAILRARRMRRGSLDLDLPEARIKFAEDGKTPIDSVQSRQDPGIRRAYSLIEEFMLLANEVVATLCLKRKAPTVFRVHGAPDEDGLQRLCAVARAFGYELDPEDAVEPKRMSKFLRKVAGTPEARVLHSVLLRSLQQARYQVDNIGHFGLASDAYLHFTSPIRRYPDVIAHRVVRHLARRERVRDDEEAVDQMRAAAAESSRLERRAMEVEREVLDLHRGVVARAHLGEVHTGIVSGLSMNGPFVQIESPFLDVMVRTSDLGEGEYELDPLGLSLVSRVSGRKFVLGDELAIELRDVSLARRSIYGVLVGAERDDAALRAKHGRGSSRGRPAPTGPRNRDERRRGDKRKGKRGRGR